MLLSCRIIPHNVFTDTASNSLFNPSSNFPRLNSIGSTDLFISGMVDYQINQHREIKAKIPVFSDLHRMVARSAEMTKFRNTIDLLISTLAQTPNMATSSCPRFFASGLPSCRVIFGRRPFWRKKPTYFARSKSTGNQNQGCLPFTETIWLKISGINMKQLNAKLREWESLVYPH